VVFGLGDLFSSDQKPHIGVHQVLRSSPASRLELSQREVRGRRALLGSNVRVRVWSHRARKFPSVAARISLQICSLTLGPVLLAGHF
jgi:hypothetical protein